MNENTATTDITEKSSIEVLSKKRAGKYLTFKLGPEEFGLGILKVQEIIGMMDVTRVPRTPEYVRGVINLRGKVIPVIDIRRTFNMQDHEDTEKTCIIVLQITTGDSEVITGVIVDEVSEVLDITPDQLEPTPEFGSSINTDFIMAMGKIANRVVMLLDLDRVFSCHDITLVSDMQETH